MTGSSTLDTDILYLQTEKILFCYNISNAMCIGLKHAAILQGDFIKADFMKAECKINTSVHLQSSSILLKTCTAGELYHIGAKDLALRVEAENCISHCLAAGLSSHSRTQMPRAAVVVESHSIHETLGKRICRPALNLLFLLAWELITA